MGRDPVNIGPDADLHLYMDGEMDAARRIAFEAHLAANPALAAKLHDYLHQREMLKLGLDMMAAAPPRATESLVGRLGRRLHLDRATRRLAPLAAAVLLMTGGWSLAVWVRAEQTGPELALTQQALPQGALPHEAEEMPAFAGEAAQAHSKAVALTTLQSAAVPADIALVLALAQSQPGRAGGMTVELPAVDPNLTLVRASFVPWNHGAALQFVYREADGELLTLFVAAGDTTLDGALHTAERDSLRLVYWRAGMVAYTVTGSKADGDLMSVAKRMADSVRRS